MPGNGEHAHACEDTRGKRHGVHTDDFVHTIERQGRGICGERHGNTQTSGNTDGVLAIRSLCNCHDVLLRHPCVRHNGPRFCRTRSERKP